jgi:hypothetical protein
MAAFIDIVDNYFIGMMSLPLDIYKIDWTFRFLGRRDCGGYRPWFQTVCLGILSLLRMGVPRLTHKNIMVRRVRVINRGVRGSMCKVVVLSQVAEPVSLCWEILKYPLKSLGSDPSDLTIEIWQV